MRPLSLTVSGLHSYREPVTIDFDDLGRFGLFGIFGRIGSGKSTLLDAMTLALYGLVDRVATRARRGLVHLGAERCEVRFRFAVDTASGAEIWEVHRAYRDEGGVAVRVASRLVRRDGARALVVAEKERDVNNAVAEVVGLGPEDFTRAVVLPQGRFVQLLHLKGHERRQMLSRLFHLQAYGEGLRLRVRDRQAAVATGLAAAHGELAGLGDASRSAVQRTRAAADRADRAAAETEATFVALRDRHDLATRRREQAERARRAVAALAEHEAGAAEHAARLSRIAAADRVAPWIGAARRYAKAVDRSAQATEAAEAVLARLAMCEQAAAGAGAARDVARARAETEEPALRDRIRRLAEVARWTDERATLAAKAESAAAERATHETIAAAARVREAEARARGSTLQQERRSLKGKLSRVRVSADERDGMVNAARAADALGTARRLLAEAVAEEAAAQEHVDRETALLARAAEAEEAARAGDRARATERIDAGRRALNAATAALEVAAAERRKAAEVLRGAANAVRKAETELEAARRTSSAALLSGSLAPGVPCPVCGSPHHPAPVEPVVHADGERFEAVLQAHRTGHERALARHDEALSAHADAQAEQARAAEMLAQVTNVQDRNETSPALERALVSRASAEAKAEAAVAARAHAATTHAQRAAEEGEAWSAFDGARGDLTLFDLPWALVGLDARDREAEEMAAAIEEAESGHAAAVAEADDARATAERAAGEARVWEERRREAEERVTALALRIAAEAGPAEPTITAQLDGIAAAARATEVAFREAEQERNAAASAAAATTAEASSARDDLASLESELPDSVDALLDAHPGESVLAAWRAEAAAWAERRVDLKARVAALHEVPAGKGEEPPDEVVFERWTDELAAARDEADHTRTAATATRTQATELAARADRFATLSDRGASLDREQARLEELGTLLRGDRFVEYVANDHLADLVARATTHLGVLTSGRYRLAVDDDASFMVHDEDAGGAVRPVHSLSGGESFLTALSLALALSTQMQAGSSRPLGFFFLDEGFGTLDPDALDRVMTAIEHLRSAGQGLGDGHRLIGLISHVPAVRDRVPRYLWVEPPAAGHGSSVTLRDN